MMQACPMQVEGTAVEVSDIAGGVALTFTTSGDVAELRRRVIAMASMPRGHGEHHRGGSGGMGMMPAAQVTTEEVPAGVRLRLTAEDAQDVAMLRQRANRMQKHMQSGQCPMMEMQAGAQR